MCGIVAAVSPAANIVPVLLEGLRKLEYRGYDSAGIAVLNGAGVQRMRTADRLRIADTSGAPVGRPVIISQLSADAVELGQYRHYMQKEIFEQPEALANTLELIGNGGRLQPGIFGADAAGLLAGVRSVLILACGTSYHSGVTARYWLESLAGIPCTVEIASEYRYRSSVPNSDQLVVAISQSGETADTLAALRQGPWSRARAGCLQRVGFRRRARRRTQAQGNLLHPRRAYAAGKLKHGPLALVDRDMPVIAVAPNDSLLDKLKSNLKEVQARGGELYVFADADSHFPETDQIHVLRLPEHYGDLSPILHVVPLQLLAYHTALAKGTDVDKPRNLAKSVTVE